MTPGERKLRGRIGGLALAAQYDPLAYTAKARSAFLARFEREVDPDGVLPEAERRRGAEAARKLYFARLALKSAKARAKRGKPNSIRGAGRELNPPPAQGEAVQGGKNWGGPTQLDSGEAELREGPAVPL